LHLTEIKLSSHLLLTTSDHLYDFGCQTEPIDDLHMLHKNWRRGSKVIGLATRSQFHGSFLPPPLFPPPQSVSPSVENNDSP